MTVKKQLWKQIYGKSLDKSDNEVYLLLKTALNTVDSSNYQNYTSDQKKFLNTIAEAI